MSKRHFIVSIKTIDDTPLFPVNFEGENFLFGATAKASAKTRVIFKGYASFPTGLEAIIFCKDGQEARKYADEVANSIYTLTNGMDHIIESFGIHIAELTNDERTLEAVMMDMMVRGMAARGIDMDSIPTLSFEQDANDMAARATIKILFFILDIILKVNIIC